MIENTVEKIYTLYKKIYVKIAFILINKNLLNIIKQISEKELIRTTTEYNILQFIKSYQKILKNNAIASFVECGVWKGTYLIIIKKLNENYKLNLPVYGYDTFEGTPKPKKENIKLNIDLYGNPLDDLYEKRKLNNNKSGWNYMSEQEVRQNIKDNLENADNIILVKGNIEDTLNYEENLPKEISILKIDTVLYESYKVSFDKLAPRIVKNGIIICDNYFTYPGVKKATDEFLLNKNLKVEFNRFSRNAIIYL